MALLAIFKNLRYIYITLIIVALVFFSISFFSQTRLIADIIPDGDIAPYEKLDIILAIAYGAITEITPNSLLTFAIAVLFSISVAGIMYYIGIYKAIKVSTASATSLSGVVSGIIAISCVSCGSVAIGFLVPFFSASSLLLFLPYQNMIFGSISIILLLISLYIINQNLKTVREYSQLK